MPVYLFLSRLTFVEILLFFLVSNCLTPIFLFINLQHQQRIIIQQQIIIDLLVKKLYD
jgi:hypothetical protein